LAGTLCESHRGAIIICNGVGYCCCGPCTNDDGCFNNPWTKCCDGNCKECCESSDCPEGSCCNGEGECVADCANQTASINELGEISQSEWVLNPSTCQCEEVKYYCV
jgi:hypothetical protein